MKDTNQSKVWFENRTNIYIKCHIGLDGQLFGHAHFFLISLKSNAVTKFVSNLKGLFFKLFK